MLIAIMRAQDKLSLLMATSQPWNDPPSPTPSLRAPVDPAPAIPSAHPGQPAPSCPALPLAFNYFRS